MNLPLKRGDIEPAVSNTMTQPLVKVLRRTDPSTYIVEGPDGRHYVAIIEPRLVVIGEER